jgi:hypothetical protein
VDFRNDFYATDARIEKVIGRLGDWEIDFVGGRIFYATDARI